LAGCDLDSVIALLRVDFKRLLVFCVYRMMADDLITDRSQNLTPEEAKV
jgi:hypothetical protein